MIVKISILLAFVGASIQSPEFIEEIGKVCAPVSVMQFNHGKLQQNNNNKMRLKL